MKGFAAPDIVYNRRISLFVILCTTSCSYATLVKQQCPLLCRGFPFFWRCHSCTGVICVVSPFGFFFVFILFTTCLLYAHLYGVAHFLILSAHLFSNVSGEDVTSLVTSAKLLRFENFDCRSCDAAGCESKHPATISCRGLNECVRPWGVG